MSFRTSKNQIATLGSTLPLFSIFFASLLLVGCVSTPQPPPAWAVAAMPVVAPVSSRSNVLEKLARSSDILFDDDEGLELSSLGDESILISWSTIDGGVRGNAWTGLARQRFKRPVAAAARGKYVYIVDEPDKAVYIYDSDLDRLQLIPNVSRYITHDVADIYVSPDLSFYLTDSSAGRVLHFTQSGKLIQIFENYLNMARPVGITVDEHQGFVLIADGSYDYVLAFDRQGNLLDAIGARGENLGEFHGLTATTLGPDGLYVTARIGVRAQVVNLDSRFRYTFQKDTLAFPTAIVVDEDNQVFISDALDNTIKIYRQGVLISTFGGTGNGSSRFNRITDMWLDEGFLYVTDSLNKRIQVLRIVPEGLLEPLTE